MNRFLSLIVAILCSSIVFAQTDNIPFQTIRLADDHGSKTFHKSNSQTRQTRDETVYWSCDFENPSAYTILDGRLTNSTWHATSEATYPSSLGPIPSTGGYYMWPMNFSGNASQEAYQHSETPTTWMILNLIGEHYPGLINQDADDVWGPIEASILFSDINLSGCQFPKFIMRQSYRAFNPTWNSMFIETSIDGVSWTSHAINVGNWDNGTYIDDPIEVLIPEVGNRSNVFVRVRYKNNDSDGEYARQYGWQVDDAKIVEAPANNLTLNDARISMFGYMDYRNVPENFWTNMTDSAKRAYAYQLYDPYAQSPKPNWEPSNAFAAFNVEYTNNGATSSTPKVNIVVTSPSGIEIYNKTLTGAPIASTVRDTTDFGTIDDENMANSTVFYFENDIELGRYTVTFRVYEEGAEDANPDDNTIVQYFDITDKYYSKSYDEPTASFCANCYTTSSSGDMYGTEFLYYYSPDARMTTDLYIADGTTIGTQVKVAIYHYDSQANYGDGGYIKDCESEWLDIDSTHIGTWTNFTFTNDYYLSFSTDETFRELLVMAEVAYDNEDDKIYFGKSDVLTSKGHSSMEYLARRNAWYYGRDDIALRFYPMPTSGTEYTINALSSNENRGYVIGGGRYMAGTTISLMAMPYEGYRFVSWYDGNTENPRTITVTGDATYIAMFEAIPHTITVLSSNVAFGTVTGGGEYLHGSQATIEAIPNEGYRFISWNDDNTENPRTITVTEDATYIASFEAIPTYTITVLSVNQTYGTATGGGTYPEGSTITIQAIANNGYVFTSWNDNSTENPRTITVTGNATYIANFSDISSVTTYTINVLSANNEQGEATGSGIYAEGNIITIEAIPNEGYRFLSWNDNNTDNPRQITVTSNATYIASFEELPAQYTITVLSANNDQGSVAGGGTFYEGTEIQISATANEGFRFAAWNDGNTANPRTITVTGDATYIATFEALPAQYTITVLSASNEQGSVAGGGTFYAGTVIQISATANEGFRFVSWNDDNTDNPRTITVTGDAIYIASFESSSANTYTITVLSTNDEQGSVDGGGTFAEGTEIQITATPNFGYRFVSWNDGSTENPRTIIVTADATYIATFEAAQMYTIEAYSDDDSNGTVTGGGTYPEGYTVTLTATPEDGYVFTSWNDGNRENPRTITVTENATFIAHFAETSSVQTYTITVRSSNDNFGTTTGSGVYAEGTIATITAIPTNGYRFVWWNDRNQDNPRQITVTGNATYTAFFAIENGVEETSVSEISIFPNPTNDILNITSSETISEIEIVNVMGQIVLQMDVNSDNAACNVSNLSNGMYFVRIMGSENNNMSVKKFVKE